MTWLWQGSKETASFRGIEIQAFCFWLAVADANAARQVLFEKTSIDRGLENLAKCGSYAVDAGARKTGHTFLSEK